ncbi:MAG TPA: VOC family protein [Devosiaceae bacterium]|jgi:catechol 2,3-dioxygenase-like lactoylglutathione lyase family enzyme|nr:VOC family protein [Devosiaceae bacterium]
MLSGHHVFATIPAADLERARTWYEEKLGLKPAREQEEEGLIYELADGSAFLLYSTTNAGQAPNTLATFDSNDVPSDVAALKQRGVKFEDYDLPGLKTENSIASIGGLKAAWFKDSEGNILAIGETIH